MAHPAARAVAIVAARVSLLLGPRTMRVIARMNRYVTNPLVRLGAPRLPYLAVVEHVGRRSGTTYRTPVMAFVVDDTISVVLNYGAGSDWVRNTRAAGSAQVVHRGRRYRLTDPDVVPMGSAEVPPHARVVRTPARSVLQARLSRLS